MPAAGEKGEKKIPTKPAFHSVFRKSLKIGKKD
jgi:hypothetical protein